MKIPYVCCGLLLLAQGALSATVATLGATCAVGDTCSVNGAVCDKTSLTCQCNYGYVQYGSICARGSGKVCGVGMCKTPDKMTCTSNKCACDTSKGYAVSGSNCACPANQQFNVAANKCLKAIGETCSADSECYTTTGMKCSTNCQCDSTLNRGGTNGAFTCECNTGYKEVSGTCRKAINEACTTASDCAPGLVCTGSKCACDASKNYAIPGTTGLITCDCAAGYSKDVSGTCQKAINEACTTASDCAPGLVCTGSKCACDASKNYAIPGTTGLITCDCATGYKDVSGTCRKAINEACTTASDCAPGLVCTGSKCACDASKNYAIPGTTGLITCGCANGYTDVSGTCYKQIDQACSAASECAPGLVCTSSKCACDSTKRFTSPGTAGLITCACQSGYTLQGGVCKINAGQTCSRTNSIPCVNNALCDKATDTCVCDDANGWSVSGVVCACKTGYTDSTKGNCLAPLDGYCVSSSTVGVCATGASCVAGNTTMDQQCLCSGTTNSDGTCFVAGGSTGIGASLLVLTTMILVTLISFWQ